MTRGTSIAGLLLLVAASAGACGDDDGGSTARESDETTSATGSAAEPPDSGEPPQIELHDAGAEPRTELRLTIEEGDVDHAVMTMTMGMNSELDGQAQPPVDSPPIEMGMNVAVAEVDDEGRTTVDFGYDELRVLGSGAMAGQMEQVLAPLADMQGSVTVTDRGEFVDADVDVPDGLDPRMSSMIDSIESSFATMTVPFPEEAVGVGARWTVRSAPELAGIAYDLAYRYEIVELEGSRVVFDVTYEQVADSQDADLPGLPPGVDVQVEEGRTEGAGTITCDLSQVFPLSSQVQAEGFMVMTMEQGSDSSTLRQDLDIGIELETSDGG